MEMKLRPLQIKESVFWLGFHYAPGFLSWKWGGKKSWSLFVILRWGKQDRNHSTINLRWKFVNDHSFWFSWPRRDNLWSRWRYEVFTRDGQRCVKWKVAEQKVCW